MDKKTKKIEQKKEQEKIKEAKEYAESIIDTIREPLIVLNNKLNVISANNSFYKIFKVSKKETIGKKIYNLGNRQWDIPKLRRLLEEILPEKTIFDNFEVEHEFQKIGKRTMILNARRIPPPPAQPERILLAIENITEKKKAQEKVKERTAELLENKEKLKKSYEKLKELDILKDQFLTMTSHELRTPITPIKIQLQMLAQKRKGKLTPNQKESLEMIIRNVNRLDRLITDIVEVSRVQTGLRLKMHKEQLSNIIKDTVNSMKAVALEKEITISTKIPSLPKVEIDKERIIQVLINLIDNAIKFTKKGKITIEAEKQKDSVLIKVSDTGIGIAPKDLKQMFDPFFQVSPSYKTRNVGTGLGLAICRGIIEGHGSKIWVKSTLGKGSVFSFTLPIKASKTVMFRGGEKQFSDSKNKKKEDEDDKKNLNR